MPKCRLCNQNCIEEDLYIICHKSNNHSIWCKTCIQNMIEKAENKNNIILNCQLCNSENKIDYEVDNILEKSVSYNYQNGNLEGENVIIYYTNEVGCINEVGCTNKVGNDFTKIKSIGNYNKGLLYGKYIEYDLEGNITIICNYNNGVLNGIYSEYKDGKIYSDINYENGLKNGIKNYYHYKNDNKIIIQIDMYKEDMLNGSSIIYNIENGKKVYEINYKNNIKDGKCIEYIYDENGDLINQNEIEYKDDNIYNGIENIYYDDNKKIKSSVLYVNGMKEGIMKYYYKNNKIECERVYKNDLLNGICKSYDLNGNVILEENYKNGVLDGKVVKNIYKEHIKNIMICGVKKEEKKIDSNKSYSYEELLKNQKMNEINNNNFTGNSKIANFIRNNLKSSDIESNFRINQFSDFQTINENDNQKSQLEEQFENNFEEHKSMMNDEDPFIRKIKEFAFM